MLILLITSLPPGLCTCVLHICVRRANRNGVLELLNGSSINLFIPNAGKASPFKPARYSAELCFQFSSWNLECLFPSNNSQLNASPQFKDLHRGTFFGQFEDCPGLGAYSVLVSAIGMYNRENSHLCSAGGT